MKPPHGFRFFLLALVVTSCHAADVGELIHLLERPDAWMRVGGTEESFAIEDGTLAITRSGNEPSAILTREDYENFILDFEFKLARWCVSGLFLHVPKNGAYRAGLEIELNTRAGHAGSIHAVGALFRKVPPDSMERLPWGEWIACRVEMDWPRLVATIDGRVVQDLDLSKNEKTKSSLRRGAIGFQNLGFGMEVRNLRLTPLPDMENALVLFDGKSLSGWKVLRGDAEWEVVDGAIRAKDGDGYLGHEFVCRDFDLRMMVRTTAVANGGVFFRWKPGDLRDRGQEIQILDVPGGVMPTGSVYGKARGNDLLLTPGEWELLQISVRGSRAVTHLNGLLCAESDEISVDRPGHIVLQMHWSDGAIEFKDIVLVPKG